MKAELEGTISASKLAQVQMFLGKLSSLRIVTVLE